MVLETACGSDAGGRKRRGRHVEAHRHPGLSQNRKESGAYCSECLCAVRSGDNIKIYVHKCVYV
jgi:hypothetical protein